MEERSSDMNEFFRAIQQTQYDKGQFEATMSHYQKGYLPAEVAAEELSMTEEQFLEAHEKWLATKQEAVLV